MATGTFVFIEILKDGGRHLSRSMQLCKSKIETVGEWGKTIANDRDVIVEVLVSSFCVPCGFCVAGKMNF